MKRLLSSNIKRGACVILSVLALLPDHTSARTSTNLPSPSVTLEGSKLVGDLSGDRATFTLTATAIVEDSKGGSLELISGNVALTEVGSHPKWRLRPDQNRYIAVFDRRGKYPRSEEHTSELQSRLHLVC